MTGGPPGPRSSGSGRRFPVSLKQIGDWLVTTWNLQRSIESQKSRLEKLEQQISRLQRQVDDQGGQLKILADFVHSSLRGQVDSRAERAALKVIEALLDAGKQPKSAAKPTPPKKNTKKPLE